MTKEEISVSLLIALQKLGFEDDQWRTWEICCIKPAAEEAAKKNISAETIIENMEDTAIKKSNCPLEIIKMGNESIINYFKQFGMTSFGEFLLEIVKNSKPLD